MFVGWGSSCYQGLVLLCPLQFVHKDETSQKNPPSTSEALICCVLTCCDGAHIGLGGRRQMFKPRLCHLPANCKLQLHQLQKEDNCTFITELM